MSKMTCFIVVFSWFYLNLFYFLARCKCLNSVKCCHWSKRLFCVWLNEDQPLVEHHQRSIRNSVKAIGIKRVLRCRAQHLRLSLSMSLAASRTSR